MDDVVSTYITASNAWSITVNEVKHKRIKLLSQRANVPKLGMSRILNNNSLKRVSISCIVFTAFNKKT